MKFLVDQQLPPVLAQWIRQRGHDARHTREFNLQRSSDQVIAALAAQDDRIIVTKDDDFARLADTRRAAPIVWLRLGNCPNEVLLRWFESHWPAVLAQLERGDRLVELR